MLLAWPDPRLKRCCTSAAELRAASGDQAAAAEDLLATVARAQTLGVVMGLRSIRTAIDGDGLTFSLEEIEMHARLLTAEGKLYPLRAANSLAPHVGAQRLLIDDLRVGGQSVTRLAG